MKKQIWFIIIMGSLWGIAESSIGYLLHLFAQPIGWLFWFPIAYYFLSKSYKKTKSNQAVMLIAFLAAGIKCTDFLLPVRPDMVFNPAVSIVLEAAAVLLVIKYGQKEEGSSFGLPHCLAASITWRALYICYVLFLPQSLLDLSPLGCGLIPFTRFMLFDSIVNALFIYAFIKISAMIRQKGQVSEGLTSFLSTHKFAEPALAMAAFMIAVIVQWST